MVQRSSLPAAAKRRKLPVVPIHIVSKSNGSAGIADMASLTASPSYRKTYSRSMFLFGGVVVFSHSLQRTNGVTKL